MDGWIKLSENGGRAVKYVNRRNIVSVNDVGGGVVATMWNGDTVRMKELPPDEPKLPYDAEVEWLESTGTQYIDTGCVASSSLGLELDMEYLGTNANSVNAPGVLRRQGSSYVRHHLHRSVTPSWMYYLGAGTVSFAVSDDARRVSVTVDAVGRTVSINGVTDSWDSVADFDTGLTYWFPARHDSNGTATPFIGRVYSARFFVDGALVRDLIPVRVGTVGYLYDRANPTGGPLGNGLYGDFSDGKGGVTGFPANLVGPDNPSAQ